MNEAQMRKRYAWHHYERATQPGTLSLGDRWRTLLCKGDGFAQTDILAAVWWPLTATKALAANDHDEEAGLHPNRIAAAVEKALTSPNPPERLAIAHWHEKLSAPLRSLLPEKLFRRIIATHYNL